MYKKDLRKSANGLGFLLLAFFGAMLILYIICVAIIEFGGAYSVFTSGSALEMLVNGLLSSAVFFFVALIYSLLTKKSAARLFPFEHVGARYAFMITVAGLAMCLLSNLAANMMTDVFGLFGLTNTGGDAIEEGAKPSVFLYYISVAVMPALAEEFAFRGVIMGTLRRYSDALALVVSSVLFALMHGNFVQIPFTFFGGLAFGFAAIKTNSLLPSIIMHFLNNGLSVTYDVLTSYGIISEDIGNLGYGVLFVITGVLALIFMKKLIKEKPDFFTFSESDKGIPFREKMKTVSTSPTLIAFAAVMLTEAVVVLLS